jgi:hypothetical protein
MQNVIVSRRGGKPIVAVSQCLVYPGIQKASWIGLILAPANVFQAPFEWKYAPVVIGGPPGMLVAAYFLFQPGHNL